MKYLYGEGYKYYLGKFGAGVIRGVIAGFGQTPKQLLYNFESDLLIETTGKYLKPGFQE